jgi:hypothetical protein
MVARDHQINIKLMEDELHIDWQMICQTVYKDLGKRKICANFVPYSVMDKQKEHRVKICEHFIQTCQSNPVAQLHCHWRQVFTVSV